mmetsp:Transcript_43583/g.88133  ORF Transcript_43583/g.88133 Transcript_43583/m.88133 type:complete len:301 (+) Transcript_43583:361-1263(+)
MSSKSSSASIGSATTGSAAPPSPAFFGGGFFAGGGFLPGGAFLPGGGFLPGGRFGRGVSLSGTGSSAASTFTFATSGSFSPSSCRNIFCVVATHSRRVRWTGLTLKSMSASSKPDRSFTFLKPRRLSTSVYSPSPWSSMNPARSLLRSISSRSSSCWIFSKISGGSCTEMVRFGPSLRDTFFFGPRFGLFLFSSRILSMTSVPGSLSSDLLSTPSSFPVKAAIWSRILASWSIELRRTRSCSICSGVFSSAPFLPFAPAFAPPGFGVAALPPGFGVTGLLPVFGAAGLGGIWSCLAHQRR